MNEDQRDIDLTLHHELSEWQVDVVLEGRLINWMRENLEKRER